MARLDSYSSGMIERDADYYNSSTKDIGKSYPSGSKLVVNVYWCDTDNSNTKIRYSNNNSSWTTVNSAVKNHGGGDFLDSSYTAYTYTLNGACRYVNMLSKTSGVAALKWSFTISVQYYTVSVSSNNTNGGTVSGGGEVQSGSSKTVTASVKSGYRFTGWYQGNTLKSSNTSYTFTVSSDITLQARFVQRFTATASASPTKGGTVSGGGTYDTGSSVTLKTTTNDGFRFLGWYNGDTLLSSNTSYTFTISSNVSYTARFVQRFTVTLNSDPINKATLTGDGIYDSGSTVTLKITPNDGFRFLGWYNGDTLVSNSAEYSWLISSSVTYTAKLGYSNVPIIYYNAKLGNVNYTRNTDNPNMCTFNATPNNSIFFLGWIIDNKLASRSRSFTKTVTGNDILYAIFVYAWKRTD